MNLRKLVRDIFIIFGITCALFVFSEVILRIIFPEKVSKREEPDPKDYPYQFNQDYLVSLKANYNIKFKSSDWISWKSNKDSFRGDELEEHPDTRIIVYGDSNVQARFSKLEDTFPYRLEEYLKEHSDKNIEVINAGLIGMGPDQNFIRFSKEVDTYRPDIVIFHVFADNDYGDIIRNRLFELNSKGDLIATNYDKEPDELLKSSPQPIQSIRKFASSLLVVKSTQKALSRILPKKNQPKKGVNSNDMYMSVLDPENDVDLIDQYTSVLKGEYDVYKKKQPRYFSHFADHYDLDIAAFPDSESPKVKVKLMEQILKKAKSLARSKHVEFIVLIQPSIIDSTENFIISYKDLQEKFPEYKRTNLADTLENICISNSISNINLYDIFQRNKPEELFFKCCNSHWNNQGQDLAARETSRYILKNILQK